jgi:hypothetical protein
LRRRRGEEGVFTCAEEGLELAALEEAVAVLGDGGAAGVVGDRGHGVGRKQSRAPGGLVAAEWSEVEWTPPAMVLKAGWFWVWSGWGWASAAQEYIRRVSGPARTQIGLELSRLPHEFACLTS